MQTTVLNNWLTVKDIYYTSSAGMVRLGFMKLENFKNNKFYYVFLILGLLIAFFQLFFPEKGWISLGFMFLVWLPVLFLLSQRMLKSACIEYGISSSDFTSRGFNLHYARFSKMCENNLLMSEKTISKMLQWQGERATHFSTFKYFSTSKFVVAAVSSVISVLVFHYKQQVALIKLEATTYLGIGLLAFFLFLIIYSIYDLTQARKKRNFLVCRFLKMYLIEIKAK